MDGQIIEDKIYEVTFQFDRGDAYENAVNPWTETRFICGRHIFETDIEVDDEVKNIVPLDHFEECVYCKL